MPFNTKCDLSKGVEVLLYIAKRVSNMYNVLKIIYFADKHHLQRYGRQIYGDSYVAMQRGPVPSVAYDLLKIARGDGVDFNGQMSNAAENFAVKGHDVIAHRDANTDWLSESETECIDEAIEEFGTLSFGQLKAISHTQPDYQNADENDFMSLEDIARSLPDGEELLEYLMEE